MTDLKSDFPVTNTLFIYSIHSIGFIRIARVKQKILYYKFILYVSVKNLVRFLFLTQFRVIVWEILTFVYREEYTKIT